MLGLVIYLLMMATAFMGYVLPWGQMSYWGAQVITGFFSAFPVVGEPMRIWLLGGYAPDQAALTRFFSLHYLLPFVIAGVVILHIWALHIPGSSNPTGVDVKDERDTLPFHPFYTAKDGWFAGAFLLVLLRRDLLCAELSRPPGQLHSGQSAGDAGATSFPNGISGRSTRSCARSPSTSSCRRSCGACWRCSARSCCCSSCRGSTSRRFARAPTARCSSASSGCWSSTSSCSAGPAAVRRHRFATRIGQICAAYYFLHFLVILPLVSRFETPLPLPNSISGERASRRGCRGGAGWGRGQSAAARSPRRAALRGRTDKWSVSFSVSSRRRLRRRPADLADRRRCDQSQQPAGAARVRGVPQGAEAAAPRIGRSLRQVRQAPAAARFPGLFGSLLGLPQPEAGVVPRSQGASATMMPRSRRSPRTGRRRFRRSIRTRAKPRRARRCRPTTSRRRSRMRSRRARRTTMRCRPTFR